jgi:two-component system response regulator (stage 0 sporulation protein F)
MGRNAMTGPGRPDNAAPAGAGGARILLAEDDEALRSLLALSLRQQGYAVIECRSGMELVKRVGEYLLSHRPIDFELVISDIRMPGVTGLEALEGMREIEGWPPTILITAFGDRHAHDEARRLGAAAMFDKPFEIDDLISVVESLLPSPNGPPTSPR